MAFIMPHEKADPVPSSPLTNSTQIFDSGLASSLEKASNPEETLEDDAPPDGGWQAWSQVLACFLIRVNTWGLVSSYGSFQAIYETNPSLHLSISATPFHISIIGSLQTFLLVFLTLFAGPLYDAGYFRSLLTTGSILIVVGTLVQSFCVQYWQFVLVQGVVVGCGVGCLNVLIATIPATWFKRKLMAANAVVSMGFGLGGMFFPVIINQLSRHLSLAWIVRIIALIILSLFVIITLILQPRVPSTLSLQQRPPVRSLIDRTVFSDLPFLAVIISSSLCYMVVFSPMLYVGSHALRLDASSKDVAPYLLVIIQASGIVGRTLPMLPLARQQSIGLCIFAMLGASTVLYCYIAATTLSGVVTLSTMYGFFSGIYSSTFTTVLVVLTPCPQVLGTRVGMYYAAVAVPILAGPPISGVLRQVYGFDAVWIWTGSVMFLGFIGMVLTRYLKCGWRLSTGV